jgi:rhodanese-related sulfurtransferase
MNNSLIDLDAESFSKKLKEDNNAVLIDVRTPFEYQQGHIPDSVLINIANPDFPDEIQKLDKSKSYYLYCRSGSRSYHAGMFMLQMGFTNIYNLESGIISWNEPLKKLK